MTHASGLTWSEGSRGDLDLTVGLVRLEGRRWAQLSRKGFWALGAGGAGAGAVTSIVRVLLLVHCHQLERHGGKNILVSFGLNLGGDHPLVLEWGWRFWRLCIQYAIDSVTWGVNGIMCKIQHHLAARKHIANKQHIHHVQSDYHSHLVPLLSRYDYS